MKVGLGTSAESRPRARMKARAKLVLPLPSGPDSAITSPLRTRAAMLAARPPVAASSGRSIVRVGAPFMADSFKTDVAVIGAGPVGLFAVFECGMLNLRCHVIDALDHKGGQCTALYPEKPIYDIPAYPRIDARELVENLVEQAKPFSPRYHLGQAVTGLANLLQGGFRLKTENAATIEARAVIIAAGAGAFGPNRPPPAGIEQYEGKSVFYLVGRREDFRGKRVVIAGGGDSAVD